MSLGRVRSMEGKNVLVGASGSVAAIRVPLLVDKIIEKGAKVKVLATDRAKFFLEKERKFPDGVEVLDDEKEWLMWEKLGDEVLHIELRRWADAFVIAPLSANTLAKLANGLCDNALTCTARAWDPSKAPLIAAPAMNTVMWEHPLTSQQINSVEIFGVLTVPPTSKKLACGDVGTGSMATPDTIVETLEIELLARSRKKRKAIDSE
uniref:Flavoprotein domain-containing protein n=1 Tax=Rhodosorus marinus TaxID=101924 RepID=A0A7S3A5B8_9RHOD|mmetsp:Transcript_44318/g.172430  ORF Transcript_44318/g.172430 Transcript_44318/m.172430 type:complete len:207 (+) Transcript_44318:275-895(+)